MEVLKTTVPTKCRGGGKTGVLGEEVLGEKDEGASKGPSIVNATREVVFLTISILNQKKGMVKEDKDTKVQKRGS